MQMLTPGVAPSYGATKYWYEAIHDPGYQQMKYLKLLMTQLPFTEGIPDQSLLVGNPGEMHDRLIANRGKDYALVYTYTGKTITIDLSKVSGLEKRVWWYDPATGALQYVGVVKNGVQTFRPEGGYRAGNDKVLVAIDANRSYLKPEWKQLTLSTQPAPSDV
jgi:hypothetical protein